jgi:hypothetical protein
MIAAAVPARYFGKLWRGELPLSRVFWTDMLVVGTIVNIAAMVAAILVFLGGAPAWLGFAVHLLPIPYNILLFMGVSRSADADQPQLAWLARAAAGAWFLVMLVV